MSRDDEMYAFATEDKRLFFSGGHPGRADAIAVVLRPQCWVQWNERGDARRTNGFVHVFDPDGHVVGDGDEKLARVMSPATPSDAWDVLTRAPHLDPVFFESVRERLVERDASGELVPLAAPRTFTAAVVLAEAPRAMRAAEELVKEAYARAAPFGVGPCPPIFWRTIARPALAVEGCKRDAFARVWSAGIDMFGYGAWTAMAHQARAAFSFSSYGADIPGLLRWVSEDFGHALQFDSARAEKRVTPSGLAFADLDSPSEPLMRIAFMGLAVQECSTDRVVLVCAEST